MTPMIFPAIIAGHLIGDFLVQTDRQATLKVRPSSHRSLPDWHPFDPQYWPSWRANQTHMLTYHLAMIACVAPVWHSKAALVALVVSWVTHSFIDRRWPVRALMRKTGSEAFSNTSWGIIVTDQVLHLSILALLVVYLGGK